jgi:hypothetical protein
MKRAVCATYSMPHAQPTLERFWSTEIGRDRAASNARCGDPATSGRYCNLAAAGGEGHCENGCGAPAGGVGCGDIGPNRQACVGDHRCEPCGRAGQASCSGTCSEGKPNADGSVCVGP